MTAGLRRGILYRRIDHHGGPRVLASRRGRLGAAPQNADPEALPLLSLRRHIDGEQLLLRRDESRSRPRCPLACVSLTASTLGTPRLVAAGIALALSEHARSHGVESPPVLVNATRSTTLSSLTELQALLDTPPAARAASVTAWRDAVAGRRGTWIATAAYLIAHEGDVAHTAEALFDGTFMLRGTAVDLRRGSEHTGAPR